jgi:ATP-dependent Clp protease adapter protein ClpS
MENNNTTVIDRPTVVVDKFPIEVPGGATVMLLNDPITPGMLVIEAIVASTGLSHSEAIRRVMTAHKGGWSAIAAYGSRDIAETIAAKIVHFVQTNQHYESYKQITKHTGPWPLTVEVVEAGHKS